MSERKTILEEAAGLTSGDRQKSYGHPSDNHGCTGALWTAYLLRRAQAILGRMAIDENRRGMIFMALRQLVTLGPREVCWLNVLQKCSRDANAHGRDNLVDAAGYLRNAEMAEEGDL